MTNKIFICCKKDAKKGQNYWTFCTLWHFLCFLGTFLCILCISFLYVWQILAFFFATYNKFIRCRDSVRQTKNTFVAVTLCDKHNNNMSVQQTILKKHIQFLCGMWQRNWRRTPKTNILLNLNFTTATKLFWGTFNVNIAN